MVMTKKWSVFKKETDNGADYYVIGKVKDSTKALMPDNVDYLKRIYYTVEDAQEMANKLNEGEVE